MKRSKWMLIEYDATQMDVASELMSVLGDTDVHCRVLVLAEQPLVDENTVEDSAEFNVPIPEDE